MSNKKDFSKAAALPPTSEQVFAEMINEAPKQVEPEEGSKAPKRAQASNRGKPKGYSGHEMFCLWLPPKAMGDAKILAKIKDCKVSDIVDAALTEYLAEESRAKLIAKYRKFFSDKQD